MRMCSWNWHERGYACQDIVKGDSDSEFLRTCKGAVHSGRHFPTGNTGSKKVRNGEEIVARPCMSSLNIEKQILNDAGKNTRGRSTKSGIS